MYTAENLQIADDAYQNLQQFAVPPGFRGRPGWLVQCWWLVEYFLFKPSPQFMYRWRCWLLRLFGAKVGKKVIIRSSCSVTYPWKVTIGEHAWIGDGVVLYSLGLIHIGHHAVVSQRSYQCLILPVICACSFECLCFVTAI